MADQNLTEFKFETDRGVRILVLDAHSIKLLEQALTQIGGGSGKPIRERKRERDAILAGDQSVPPMLYKRFHKMMQERLGASPVRIEVEGGGTAVFTEGATSRGRGKAVRGAAKSLSIGEQIGIKRDRKKKDARQGRIYRDFLPVVIGPTIGRKKGDPTSNIFAVGKHRGTVYVIEQISAPHPLPAPENMPKSRAGRKRAQKDALAPYLWQARVLSHPWTRVSRGGFGERQGPGSAQTSSSAGTARGRLQPAAGYMFRTGDLITHIFPVYEGIGKWEEAQEDVERAIDRSYAFRVAKGDIPPELERFVKDEVKKVRSSGRTPSLAPTRRKKKNPPRKKAKKKATKKKAPTRNGMLEDWKERRTEAKDMQAAIKAKLRAEAAVSRHESKEAGKEEERAAKRAERAKTRAGRSAERDRKQAASDKYRAEQIAEHGEQYGTTSYTIGTSLGKMYRGGSAASTRFAKLFTKSEEKKLSSAVRGQRAVFKSEGGKHVKRFEESFKKWHNSVKKGKPDFAYLLDSYEELLVGHAYLTLGGKDDRTAKGISNIRDALLGYLKCVDPAKASLLNQTVMKGVRGMSSIRGNPKNPTTEVHQEMGQGFLAESEKLWDSYCKTHSAKTLLDAYRVLELAYQEFEYTGDKKRMKQAADGIKAARSEIMSGLKKPVR